MPWSRAYRRGSALQKRARLMPAWASFVTTPSPGAPIVNAHLRGCDFSPPETAVQARGRA